jgi:hypoxanthine phosphoribosyltransferase
MVATPVDSSMKRLLDEQAIQGAVDRLAQQLAADYAGRPLTVLGVLTGSIIFLSDVIRRIDLPLRVGLIQASSYRGKATTPGELSVNASLVPDIAGRHVVLLDDIFDTGRTLARLMETISGMGPASLKSAVLLWKEGRQEVEITPDYHGFRIPDVFVVGYGLDYNDEYRHLPYLAALEEADL